MIRILLQIQISFAFLIANVLILLAILVMNRRTGTTSARVPPPAPETHGEKLLSAADILGWEFEYACRTASEAMRDRHTMVNFYLLAVGVVASGTIAVLGQDADLPKATGTVLLWLLCGIGWLYFLKIIRLRQAWHDSARTMNQIKEFYMQHVKEFTPDVLCTAFRWQAHTLPPPDKPWTVFFYSATLIASLDSVGYVAGGMLIDLDTTRRLPVVVGGLLGPFGLVFFAFHVWLYFAFLKTKAPMQTAQDTQAENQ